MTLDLRPDYLELVKTILRKHLPLSAKVYAFGSRVTGKARPFSDLDLAIDFGNEKLSQKTMISLKFDFEESILPYKVDVLDINDISPAFRKIVEKDMISVTLEAGCS